MGFAEDTGQDVTGMILAAGVRRLPAGAALPLSTNSAAIENAVTVNGPANGNGPAGAVQTLGTLGLPVGLVASVTGFPSAVGVVAVVAPSAATPFRGAPTSDIILSVPITPPAANPGGVGGSLITLGAALDWTDAALDWTGEGPAPAVTPPAASDDAPAAGHHGSSAKPAAAAPTIAWDSQRVGDVDGFGGGVAGAAQDWLDDFVNHLGQNETTWNPNAGIRVRPNAPVSGS